MEVLDRRFDKRSREFAPVQEGDETLDHQDATGSVCAARQ